MTLFRGVIFDLFHTLTGPDQGLAEYPKTNQVLGIDDVTWQRAQLATRDPRMSGAIRDPFQIVRAMADVIDPTIPTPSSRKRPRRASGARRMRWPQSRQATSSSYAPCEPAGCAWV